MMCKFLFYFVFFKKLDFNPDPEMDPDPELSEKSDPEPDPEIIFSAPTHCYKAAFFLIYPLSVWIHIQNSNLLFRNRI